jgi:hypothetical protein
MKDVEVIAELTRRNLHLQTTVESLEDEVQRMVEERDKLLAYLGEIAEFLGHQGHVGNMIDLIKTIARGK